MSDTQAEKDFEAASRFALDASAQAHGLPRLQDAVRGTEALLGIVAANRALDVTCSPNDADRGPRPSDTLTVSDQADILATLGPIRLHNPLADEMATLIEAERRIAGYATERQRLERAVIDAAKEDVVLRDAFTALDDEYAANDGFRSLKAYREWSARQDTAEKEWLSAKEKHVEATRALLAFEAANAEVNR